MGRRSLVQHRLAAVESLAGYDLSAPDALDNFWSIFGATNVTTQVAPVNSPVAVILLTPKLSGKFEVDVDIGYSDNVTGDVATWILGAGQVTVPGQSYAVAGTTPVAAGFGGSTAGGGAAGFVQTAASGMTVNN